MYSDQSSEKHIWDHTEEEMLAVVSVTEDYEDLQRLLQTEMERRVDYKPRKAVIDAILAKIQKCGTSTKESEHCDAMRKIFDSYGESQDPRLADKFRLGQQRGLESFRQTIDEIQKRDEKRQQILEAMKNV
jgi:hypothetical protein